MAHILLIQSSPRGKSSASNVLSEAVVEKLQAKHPGSQITRRDLTTHPLPHIDPVTLAAFFNRPETHTDHDRRAIQNSNQAIDELLAADFVVVGVPMWNFSVPSVLKAWIDHVARAGRTFKYTEQGVVGLLTGKKVYLALATGGIYSSGPARPLDFLEPYLRTVFSFLGMTDITSWRAEGTSLKSGAQAAIDKATAQISV